MKKTVILSIHVDGYYGLTLGVPKILDLLKKYNLKASFFVSMGRESSLIDLIKLRGLSHKNKEKVRIEGRYTSLQKLMMILLNRRIGSGHGKILKRIEKEGHEVNPHCWSHLNWSKNFKNIDVKKEFEKICEFYSSCLNHPPEGFVPPVWIWDNRVLQSLKENEFKYMCILSETKKPFLKENLVMLPLSLDYALEELLSQGKPFTEILDIYKKELNKDYAHLYFHADYEGIKGIKMFEKILSLIQDKTSRCQEIYPQFVKSIK